MYVYRILGYLKKILFRYRRRIIGVFKYILDYKIVFLSLVYILSTFFFLDILRNIKDRATMGLILVLVFSFFLFLFLLVFLRNISKHKKEKIRSGDWKRSCWKIFVHLIIIALIILLAFLKITAIVNLEMKTSTILSSFTNEKVSFEGYVYDEVDKKHRFSQLKVKQLQGIESEWVVLERNHGYILVKTENYEKFNIGQVCKFTGVLVEPESFSDFDYIQYLKDRKIYLILENPSYYCWDVKQRRGGSKLRNALVDFKQDIIKKIDYTVHEPQSSLLTGILFGQKRLFNTVFEENVRIAGVSHIVAASGYNITILIISVNKVLFFLPKRYRIIIGLIVIWCFALLSGLSSSIVRACIMNTISLIALFWGRGNNIHISLPLTVAIFLFFDPLILFDIGFLLSTAATLGLVYISPILVDMRKRFLRRVKFLDDYVLPTLSCTLATLPVSVGVFETFSIWSVPVNVIVLPIIESTMLWGILYILFLNIHRPLSYLFVLLADLQLKYFEYIVDIIGSQNWGVWELIEWRKSVFSISIIVFVLLFVIYFYPIKNEQYNWYIKSS